MNEMQPAGVRMTADRVALAHARSLIDGVDDGLVALMAARRRLVGVVGRLKLRCGVPPKDPLREHRVRERAHRLAARLGVPDQAVRQMLDIAIADACRQQGLPDAADNEDSLDTHAMNPVTADTLSQLPPGQRLLRMIPPPRRLAPLIRMVPHRLQERLLESLLARVLDAPARDGSLDFMQGRRLGIEVSDLDIRWVLEWRDDRLRLTDQPPEASVRGTATDLLLLAGRLEDADTLFFQRALVLTGDTELGLTARNLLERLPWESVPLGLRIALNRGGRLARTARAAHHCRRS